MLRRENLYFGDKILRFELIVNKFSLLITILQKTLFNTHVGYKLILTNAIFTKQRGPEFVI